VKDSEFSKNSQDQFENFLKIFEKFFWGEQIVFM
jgi:hypothetical protein